MLHFKILYSATHGRGCWAEACSLFGIRKCAQSHDAPRPAITAAALRARHRRRCSSSHDAVFVKGQMQRAARPLRRDESYAHMMMSADEPPSPVES